MPESADILVSAIAIDLVTLATILMSGRGGSKIREWYQKYGMGAISMDVLSAFIGAYIALHVSSKLEYQVLAAIGIVLIHDLTFGLIVKSLKDKSPIMGVFSEYADEVGFKILIADSLIVIGTLLVGHVCAKFVKDKNKLAAVGVILAYLLLLFVYSF